MDSLKIARVAGLAVAGAALLATLLPPSVSLLSNLQHNLHGLRNIYQDEPQLDPSPTSQIADAVHERLVESPLKTAQRVSEIAEKLPDPKIGYAIAARLYQRTPIVANLTDAKDRQAHIEIAQAVLQMVEKGSVNDSNNAFWPLCRAYAYASLRDHDNFKQAFVDASRCTTFDEYAWESVDLEVRADSTPSNIERLRAESMILFPNLSQIKTAATILVYDDPSDIEARVAVAKSGLVLAKHSKFGIDSVVGIAIARLGLWDTSHVKFDDGVPRSALRVALLQPNSLTGYQNLDEPAKQALAESQNLADFSPHFDLADDPSTVLVFESVPERLVTIPWLASLFALCFVGAAVALNKAKLSFLPHLLPGFAATMVIVFPGVHLDPLPLIAIAAIVPAVSWLNRNSKLPIAPLAFLAASIALSLTQNPVPALTFLFAAGAWYLAFRLSNPRALAWTSSVFSVLFATTSVLPVFTDPPFDLQAALLTVGWVGISAGAVFTQVSPFRRNLIVSLVAGVALLQTVLAFTALSALDKAAQNGLDQWRAEAGQVQSQVKTYLQSLPGDKSPATRVE